MKARAVGAFVVLGLAACHRPSTSSTTTTSSSASSFSPSTSASPSSSSWSAASIDIATHASPAPSVGPPVVTAGSVDGAALRARIHARLEKDRSPVTILQGTSARTLGEKICEAVVPKRPAETPVLLKPNLGGFDWFKDPKTSGGDDGVAGRITDPEFVRGVIRCLKARGHTKITVAEGWGATHKDWEKLVRVSGYEAMTKEEGVPLVAMDDDGVFDSSTAMEGTPGKPLAVTGMEKTNVPTLLVPKILADHLDHGLFVSIPKMKAHRFGVFSMGIKGVQGTVMLSDASPAFRQKWRMHRELNPWLDARKKAPPGEADDRASYVKALEKFAERIADVLEVEAPDAVLLEGAPAMGGDGFQKLYPTGEHVAIGGTNVVMVDRVGAEFLGFWNNATLAKELLGHGTSPLLEVAAKRFHLDLTAPAVSGDGAPLLAVKRPVHFVAMAPFSIHSGPTPSTLPTLAPEPSASVSAATSDKDKPTVHAAALGTDTIAIDGKGTDAAWARATPAIWDTDYAASKTEMVTKARFLWSKEALYALFELEGAGLYADTTKPTNVEREGLYKEDCVELFVTPDPTVPAHYYEIEVGPFGHWFDIDVDHSGPKKKDDIGWSSGAEIATTRDSTKHTAVIEVRIPAKEIVGALAAGKKLPLGLFRMEGKKFKHYLAWSPPRTNKPNFHVYEAFGLLVID